jgi:hypothetical protein
VKPQTSNIQHSTFNFEWRQARRLSYFGEQECRHGCRGEHPGNLENGAPRSSPLRHPCSSVIQSCNFAHGRQRFGLRWQSAATTPLSVRPVASKSGVAPALRDSRRSPKSVVAAKAALGLPVVKMRSRGIRPSDFLFRRRGSTALPRWRRIGSRGRLPTGFGFCSNPPMLNQQTLNRPVSFSPLP